MKKIHTVIIGLIFVGLFLFGVYVGTHVEKYHSVSLHRLSLATSPSMLALLKFDHQGKQDDARKYISDRLFGALFTLVTRYNSQDKGGRIEAKRAIRRLLEFSDKNDFDLFENIFQLDDGLQDGKDMRPEMMAYVRQGITEISQPGYADHTATYFDDQKK